MTVTEKLNGYGPLAGIKVVEMCTYVAAPATVRVLSEMGAEVIKIESFAGDTQRTQGPGFGCELTDTDVKVLSHAFYDFVVLRVYRSVVESVAGFGYAQEPCTLLVCLVAESRHFLQVGARFEIAIYSPVFNDF